MVEEIIPKPTPDQSLTPTFQPEDVSGRTFGQSYPRELREGMDVVHDTNGNIYAINYRFDKSRIDFQRIENRLRRSRPNSIPTNDLTIGEEKLEYNTGKYPVISVRFGSSLNEKKWTNTTKIAFAKKLRTETQLSGIAA